MVPTSLASAQTREGGGRLKVQNSVCQSSHDSEADLHKTARNMGGSTKVLARKQDNEPLAVEAAATNGIDSIDASAAAAVNTDVADDDIGHTRYGHVPAVNRGRTCVLPEELIKLSKGKCTFDDLMDCAIQYLEEQALLQEYCQSRSSPHHYNACHCLQIFVRTDPNEPARFTTDVAKFMIYFGKQTRHVQQRLVMSWIKQARYAKENEVNKNCFYNVPCLLESSDPNEPPMEWSIEEVPRICYGALLTILGKGREFYYTCKKAVETNQLPVHAAKGKRSNNGKFFDNNVSDDLHLFFNELLDNYKHVRKTAKNGEPYNEIVDPRITSRRELFRIFCWERGWKVNIKPSRNNRKNGSTEVVERTAETDGWDPTLERLAVCSRITFDAFWVANYPSIQVQPHRNSRKEKRKPLNAVYI